MSVKFKSLKKIAKTNLMDHNREGKESKTFGSKKSESKYFLLEVNRQFRWLPYSFFDLAKTKV